jgi:TnpA family transposase
VARSASADCFDPSRNRDGIACPAKTRFYPRQNSLAAALREIGRIERTLFILEWLQSPDLRRRVQVGLNKGEAKNALARAVFFNSLGEMRDRTFENQRYRASGLNLVVAAIILWNVRSICFSRRAEAVPTSCWFISHLWDGSTSI